MDTQVQACDMTTSEVCLYVCIYVHTYVSWGFSLLPHYCLHKRFGGGMDLGWLDLEVRDIQVVAVFMILFLWLSMGKPPLCACGNVCGRIFHKWDMSVSWSLWRVMLSWAKAVHISELHFLEAPTICVSLWCGLCPSSGSAIWTLRDVGSLCADSGAS